MNAHLAPSFDILFRGFSGYTTRCALEIVPRVFQFLNPAIVTLFWGANDSSSEG